jgi:hypothetical protein
MQRVQPIISKGRAQTQLVAPPFSVALCAAPRSSWAHILCCALGPLLSVCCDQPQETALRDTEGRRFVLTCHKADCTLAAAASKEGEALPAVQFKPTGRLQAVCSAANTERPPQASECRALVCKSDGDCPPDPGTPRGHCLNGLCVDPVSALGPDDAVMLCLAGTGLGRKRPEQVERYAMALNCGDPCQIPRPCRQP